MSFKPTIDIDGGLEGGLLITALMPLHLRPRGPREQCLILSQGDSIELAKRLSKMLEEYKAEVL